MIAIIGLHTIPILRPDFDPKATVSGVPSLVITGQYEFLEWAAGAS